MGSCFKKKAQKTRAKKIVKGKPQRGTTRTVRPEPRPNTASFETLQARNPAYQAQQRNKARRKKKAKQAALRDATTTGDVDTVTTGGDNTVVTGGDDITTSSGGIIGGTSVTAESIYTRDPEDAISDQEKLAQEELRRQRIKRARAKQSLLRKRLERTQEVGSGRRVLSGSERELNVQTRQAGTGSRGGAGRRSLITGSTGGIGYYSRFL
jgi:hypothetical protein